MTRFISAFQFKKFGNWDWATNSIALWLAKWALSRAALASTPSLPARVVTLFIVDDFIESQAFASRTRGDAKDGRSVASRALAIGSADASFAETGRRGTRLSRGSGLGAADGGAGSEHSVAAPRRLRAMFCWAPSRAKNRA